MYGCLSLSEGVLTNCTDNKNDITINIAVPIRFVPVYAMSTNIRNLTAGYVKTSSIVFGVSTIPFAPYTPCNNKINATDAGRDNVFSIPLKILGRLANFF